MLHGWDGSVACLIMDRWTLLLSMLFNPGSWWRHNSVAKYFPAAVDIITIQHWATPVTIIVRSKLKVASNGRWCPAESADYWQSCVIIKHDIGTPCTHVSCAEWAPCTAQLQNICIINHVCVFVHSGLTRFLLLTFIAIFWLSSLTTQSFVIYFHIFITNIFTNTKCIFTSVIVQYTINTFWQQ